MALSRLGTGNYRNVITEILKEISGGKAILLILLQSYDAIVMCLFSLKFSISINKMENTALFYDVFLNVNFLYSLFVIESLPFLNVQNKNYYVC